MANFFSRYRRIILFILALILVFWLVWILRNILLPFLLGLILAYLLLPPILWLEKRLPRKNRLMQLKRILLVLFIYFIAVAIIGITAFFTIPVIISSIADFIASLPELIPEIFQTFQGWFNRTLQILPPEIQQQISGYLENILGIVGEAIWEAVIASAAFLTANIGLILGFASLPVFLFYILKDKEKLIRGFYSGMPSWTAEQAKNIIGIIEDVLGRYIRSQLLLSFVVGLLDFIGLYILGIPFAPALAFWAALTEFIPILGPWLGGAAGVIVTLAVMPDKIIWVVIVYLSVQLLENNVLIPRIQGQFLRIHPAIILILIVIGGYFAGLWGIILIVPLTATIIRLYRYVIRTGRREEFKGPGSRS